jgi:cytochrome bd-type quinol oxidase subunit 2
VSGPNARGWEAVEHADERLRERAAARQRDGDRRRRRRGWMVWILRISLPILGAAAVLATLESRGGDLAGWSATTAAALLAAELIVPAVLAGLTARDEGWAIAVLWALVTVAATVVLTFGAGFEALGLGPR